MWLVGRILGCETEWYGTKTFAMIDRRRRIDAPFSHRAQLISILETCEIDLVLDVGANEGQFGRLIRRFYRGAIYSFEPVEEAFGRLACTAAEDPNWYVFKLGLGNSDAKMKINVPTETDFSSLLKANDYCINRFGDGARAIKTEEITVVRLDRLLEQSIPGLRDKRIFLKMDTQGYDLEVFKGLGSLLDQTMVLQTELPVIPIYEGMPHWTESIATFEKAGLQIVGMFPISRDSEWVVEYDCLLARKNCQARAKVD